MDAPALMQYLCGAIILSDTAEDWPSYYAERTGNGLLSITMETETRTETDRGTLRETDRPTHRRADRQRGSVEIQKHTNTEMHSETYRQ